MAIPAGGRGQLLQGDPLGQHPDRRWRRSRPSARPARRAARGEGFAEAGRLGATVKPGQGDLEVQAVRGHAAARGIGRHRLGDPPPEVRFHRIVEPQLEPGAEGLADGRADLRPATGRDHQVDAVLKPGGGDLRQLLGELLVVAQQRRPSCRSPAARRPRARVRAARRARAPGHRPSSRCRARGSSASRSAISARTWRTVALTRSGSSFPHTPPRCGSPIERAKQAAAEVERVGAHLVGRVGGEQRGQQRAQQRALARLRCADHGEVTAHAAQIEHERVLPLLGGPVKQADRGPQPLAGRAVTRGAIPPGRRAQYARKRLAGGQRRQPDLVDDPLFAVRLAQSRDEHVKLRHGRLVAPVRLGLVARTRAARRRPRRCGAARRRRRRGGWSRARS